MKKNTSLLIAFLFISVLAHSQNTCIVAKVVHYAPITDTIPPVGTISPVGPDLSCLLSTERQLWYYLPVCEDMPNMMLDVNTTASFTDTVGGILYGPFSQKVINCSDLTAAKIIDCEPYLNASTQFFVTTTLLEGNYYYMVLTFGDNVTGNAQVWASNFSSFQDCYECNNQVSVIHQNNLCLVSVDTAINKCVLTWEEFSGTNLAGYTVMRETSLTGLYDSLTTIPLGSLSTYTDVTSSPSQHNETYKIVGTDSCGQHNILQFNPELTSIHLISFAGGNNQANLIWNNVYTNTNFVPQYFIYRNNNGTGWQVIDSIGITLATITYTDIFAPAGNNQYTVELRKVVPCIPMRLAANSYQSVFSNTSITTVTGTEEFLNNSSISIYPNPVHDFLYIYNNFTDTKEITIELFNLYGQKLSNLYTGKTSSGKEQPKFSMKEYPAGIYLVKMNIDGKEEVRKVVKL